MTKTQAEQDQLAELGLFPLTARPPLRQYLASMWDRREYTVRVPLGNLQARNMDTTLGNLWHLLNPLLSVSVYALIFGVILGTNRGVDNYILFLATGIFMFQYTTKSATVACRSISGNEGLIRSIRFPRAILPLSSVITETMALVPTLIALLGVALLTGQFPTWTWLLFPLLIPFQALLNVGLAFAGARINYGFRDFYNILPFLFRLLFYMSGILFSVETFVENTTVRALFVANPLYSYVSLYRWALMGEDATPWMLVSALTWTAVVFVSGAAFFLAAEESYGRA